MLLDSPLLSTWIPEEALCCLEGNLIISSMAEQPMSFYLLWSCVWVRTYVCVCLCV